MTIDLKTAPVVMLTILRYRDCTTALRILTKVFGLQEGVTTEFDAAGNVTHSEIWHGNTGLIIAPVRDTAFGKLMRQPDEAGGVTQRNLYVIESVDEHHDRSVAAGLEIVMPLTTLEWGAREYSVRDHEGHIWTFSDYIPKR